MPCCDQESVAASLWYFDRSYMSKSDVANIRPEVYASMWQSLVQKVSLNDISNSLVRRVETVETANIMCNWAEHERGVYSNHIKVRLLLLHEIPSCFLCKGLPPKYVSQDYWIVAADVGILTLLP